MIVSDATALIALINIEAFDLLARFTDRIILPPEVYHEVARRPHARLFLERKIDEGFVTVRDYENRQVFREIHYILDAGESAAITLAIETALPLIIDERKGRTFARAQGVEIIGLVGILRFLYVEEKLSREETREIIARLNASDFRISSWLLEWIVA